MHNGQVSGFERIRRRMEGLLSDDLFHARIGSTDSELLFLLAIEFGLDADPAGAIARAIAVAETFALEAGGEVPVRFTAAVSDGRALHAIRYATDNLPPTLYAAPVGNALSCCFVSEPLNDDVDRWIEILNGSVVTIGDHGMVTSDFRPSVVTDVAPAMAAAV